MAREAQERTYKKARVVSVRQETTTIRGSSAAAPTLFFYFCFGLLRIQKVAGSAQVAAASNQSRPVTSPNTVAGGGQAENKQRPKVDAKTSQTSKRNEFASCLYQRYRPLVARGLFLQEPVVCLMSAQTRGDAPLSLPARCAQAFARYTTGACAKIGMRPCVPHQILVGDVLLVFGASSGA